MRFLLDHDVPDDLSYLIQRLGHEVVLLRDVLPWDSPDRAVLQYAHESGYILLTCNRNDFLRLAESDPHAGIIIVIRRRTRADEKLALFRLLERAGRDGIERNINFA